MTYSLILPEGLYNRLEKLNSDRNLNQNNIFNRLLEILRGYPEIFVQWEDTHNKNRKKKMDVDRTIQHNGFSGTLKHYLAGCGFGNILEALLIRDNNKNINTKNEYGETLLDLAYASGNSTTINTIIAMGGITSEALVAATEGTMEEMEVAEYTSRSIDVLRDQDGNTLLHLAAMSGDIQVIKALLAAGASVNAKNSEGMFKKVCQTAFLVQLNFQSTRKENIKLRYS